MTAKTSDKAATVTTTKVVVIDKTEIPKVWAEQNEEWFVNMRTAIEAYEAHAIQMRKKFDQLLEMAQGEGWAREVTKLTKPRGRKPGEKGDPFAFLDD